MRVTKRQAVQVHSVPDRAVEPQGPFPRELFREPELIIDDYDRSEYGDSLPLGATAQNNFKPPRYLRCALCLVRVLETETEDHVCEE